ncbi:hypothetical protein AMS68_004956 [Peltaster fructicola]|uniref:Fucose-specific lectin n=1 Tax=Peltaster fructicola TaxID=286661 RepID=A0A6H0XXU0_9PEZI|nr:hypothetical protein AMS68_004956 [Peltaster fructicola]
MSSSKASGSDGPEVVHYDHSAPEAIEAQNVVTSAGATSWRASHQDLPEAVVLPEQPMQNLGLYYPSHSVSSSVDEQHYKRELLSQDTPYPPKRRKRPWIWILVAALLVLLAAGGIAGGVVAMQKANTNTSNDSSKNASPATAAGSPSSTVSRTNSSPTPSLAIAGSPLAATSFVDNGKNYRILAFVNAEDQVVVTNTTGDGKWSTPTEVATGDTVLPSSPALTICADTKVLKGLRLYYASHNNYVQEVAFDLGNRTWSMLSPLHEASPKSGVACTIQNGINHLYYRKNHAVVQWRKNYADVDPKWDSYQASSQNYTVDISSDIEVTTDGAGTDYIFYVTSKPVNGLWRSSYDAASQAFINYVNLTQVSPKSRFAAAPVGSGSNSDILLLSQAIGTNDISWGTTSSADGLRGKGGVVV